jgi:uncharacterized phage-associated protein
MLPVDKVAKYLIRYLPVDNLKLQKLLYYSQAFHLVLHDKIPLFPEPIEAWDYGPVVPPVYRKYKPYGFDILRNSGKPPVLSADEKKTVDMVIGDLGFMTGTELINLTHRETPWINAYKPGRPSGIISLDSMYKFFKENIEIPSGVF